MNEATPVSNSASSVEKKLASDQQKGIQIWKYFSNKNPFYLLSFACLLHGTALSMSDASAINNPWPRMLMTCGYLLACSFIAWYVVRRLKLWDDARTLLLIISLLFLELALTFDDPLLGNLKEGISLILVGYVFSTLLFEVLLWALQIRFPACYRVPSHALLALLFLYPILLHPEIAGADETLIRWRIYAFSWVIGLFMLGLIPAVRKAKEAISNNGTPWSYPLFPWSWIFFLFLGLIVRSYTQALSFDSVLSLSRLQAMELPSIYGAYFLTPILLAIAILLTSSRNSLNQEVGSLLPYLAMVFSVQWRLGSLPFQEFLESFETSIGSPFLLAATVSCLFYAIKLLQGFQFAQIHLMISLVLLSFHTPLGANPGERIDFEVEFIPLWIAASLQVWQGIKHSRSFSVTLGIFLFLAGLRFDALQDLPTVWLDFGIVHLAVASLMICAWKYHDPFATFLQKLLPIMITGLVALCFVKSEEVFGQELLRQAALSGYSIFIAVLAATFAYAMRDQLWAASSVLSFAIGNCEPATDLYYRLSQLPGWSGIGSFAIAFALLLIGLFTSVVRRE